MTDYKEIFHNYISGVTVVALTHALDELVESCDAVYSASKRYEPDRPAYEIKITGHDVYITVRYQIILENGRVLVSGNKFMVTLYYVLESSETKLRNWMKKIILKSATEYVVQHQEIELKKEVDNAVYIIFDVPEESRK